MTDKLDTIWEADPHTLAKHAILARYLQAWIAILSHQSAAVASKNEVLFIDGFAGPGIYKKGEAGSPIIALTSLRYRPKLPRPVRFLFIELNQARYAVLKGEVDKELELASLTPTERFVEVRQGECDSILTDVLAKHEKERLQFGPALAFLDQFGYGAVSMELISKIMQFGQCEVFSYIDYKNMNRWIGEQKQSKADAFNRAFGSEDWKQCIDLPEKQRRTRLLSLYIEALKTKAKVKYVKDFLMHDKNGTPLYWLVFCTNHLRGLEEMKKAMWTVDQTGEFRFSDHDAPGQLDLLADAFSQDWLAKTLRTQLGGRTMSVLEIKEYVLDKTSCVQFKPALIQLENDDALVFPGGNRRKGDFSNEGMMVKFKLGATRLFD